MAAGIWRRRDGAMGSASVLPRGRWERLTANGWTAGPRPGYYQAMTHGVFWGFGAGPNVSENMKQSPTCSGDLALAKK